MREILSNKIGHEPIQLGEQHDSLAIYDGLDTPVSHDIIRLSSNHTKQIELYAARAASEYGDANGVREPTHAATQHDVPAMVVRVDCTVNNGQIVPYEMEDSPSGQGVTDAIHRAVNGNGIKDRIREHYVENVGEIPHVHVSGMRSHGTDDALIVGEENYSISELPQSAHNKLLIVKAIPGVKESHLPHMHLQSQLLAPLATEGEKSYAERIGQLKTIDCPDDLLQSEGELSSQVLKARLGSMAMGVSIYLKPNDRAVLGKKGTVTASRLRSEVTAYQARGGALIQEFASPIQLENAQACRNAILRVFVLLSKGIKAQAIGGCYVARPELIVHGAANAVSGAVVLE